MPRTWFWQASLHLSVWRLLFWKPVAALVVRFIIHSGSVLWCGMVWVRGVYCLLVPQSFPQRKPINDIRGVTVTSGGFCSPKQVSSLSVIGEWTTRKARITARETLGIPGKNEAPTGCWLTKWTELLEFIFSNILSFWNENTNRHSAFCFPAHFTNVCIAVYTTFESLSKSTTV